MSDRAQWEKTFKRIDQERADARYEKEVIAWAITTSRNLHVEQIKKETTRDVSSVRKETCGCVKGCRCMKCFQAPLDRLVDSTEVAKNVSRIGLGINPNVPSYELQKCARADR